MTVREQIQTFVGQRGRFGATCDEVVSALGVPHHTASSAMSALTQGEKLRTVKSQRLTRRNRKATVYVKKAQKK